MNHFFRIFPNYSPTVIHMSCFGRVWSLSLYALLTPLTHWIWNSIFNYILIELNKHLFNRTIALGNPSFHPHSFLLTWIELNCPVPGHRMSQMSESSTVTINLFTTQVIELHAVSNKVKWNLIKANGKDIP